MMCRFALTVGPGSRMTRTTNVLSLAEACGANSPPWFAPGLLTSPVTEPRHGMTSSLRSGRGIRMFESGAGFVPD